MVKALIINDQKDCHFVLKHKFKTKICFDSAYDVEIERVLFEIGVLEVDG